MLICYSSHRKLIDEESHTYGCCGIRCGDTGKVLVTEHGFTKSSINLSILLRPSGPASWPFVILHPLTHPPHVTLYKQASPTWIATSEKLSPVSWKISPSRKMGHCGSRVLWNVQVLFKSGKMFLLHMMESKQASLLNWDPSLSWEWTSVVPGTVRASNDPAFWESHPCVFPAYTVQCWSVWPVIYDRSDGVSLLHLKIQWLLSWLLSCLLALWLGSLALGSQPPCPKGTQAVQRRSPHGEELSSPDDSHLSELGRGFSSLSQVWRWLQPPLTVWLYPERPRARTSQWSHSQMSLWDAQKLCDKIKVCCF